MPAQFQMHPRAEERLASARALVKGILALPDLIDEHKREFIKLALWKVTEAEWKSKHKTGYCSEEVFLNPSIPARDLRHGHVCVRARMADELIRHPDRADEILDTAVGCTVTADEHKRIGALDKTLHGWDRYTAAGIAVFDRVTGRRRGEAG